MFRSLSFIDNQESALSHPSPNTWITGLHLDHWVAIPQLTEEDHLVLKGLTVGRTTGRSLSGGRRKMGLRLPAAMGWWEKPGKWVAALEVIEVSWILGCVYLKKEKIKSWTQVEFIPCVGSLLPCSGRSGFPEQTRWCQVFILLQSIYEAVQENKQSKNCKDDDTYLHQWADIQ